MDAHPVRPVIIALVEQHAAEVAALIMLRTIASHITIIIIRHINL